MKDECFWDDKNYKPGAPLHGEESTDFLIVGAGVAGLFAAYFLLKHGVKNVVVVERNEIGSGSTGHSAGMLVSDLETGPWSQVYGVHGRANASLYYRAQKDALDEVALIIEEAKIECDFSWRDFLIVAGEAEGEKRIITEFGAHQKLGSTFGTLLEGEDLKDELNSPLFTMGERVDKGISVNPMQFIRGVGAYLRARGVRIYEGTNLLNVSGEVAHTTHGDVTFKKIIFAQGTAEKHANLRNFATTLGITIPLPEAKLEELRLMDRDMFIDTEKPSYHYAKVTGDNRLMVGYGDDVVDVQSGSTKLFEPHIIQIENFLNRFAGPEATLEYGWTGVFSLSRQVLPHIDIKEGKAIMAGMGTQTACIAAADHTVAMMVKGEHHLEPLFNQKLQSQ
ncbi:MAG: FAD-binding oxidoreductase [Patescibacteria group bacterium]